MQAFRELEAKALDFIETLTEEEESAICGGYGYGVRIPIPDFGKQRNMLGFLFADLVAMNGIIRQMILSV